MINHKALGKKKPEGMCYGCSSSHGCNGAKVCERTYLIEALIEADEELVKCLLFQDRSEWCSETSINEPEPCFPSIPIHESCYGCQKYYLLNELSKKIRISAGVEK